MNKDSPGAPVFTTNRVDTMKHRASTYNSQTVLMMQPNTNADKLNKMNLS